MIWNPQGQAQVELSESTKIAYAKLLKAEAILSKTPRRRAGYAEALRNVQIATAEYEASKK